MPKIRNIYQEAVLKIVWYNEQISDAVEFSAIVGGILSDVSTYESGHLEKMNILDPWMGD